MIAKSAQKKKELSTRPPVVVVLGHIDHGKTTLLDFIRQSKVVEKEKGGITQHIGAYQVEHQGKKITFIDTPGHQAFAAMRSRGAKVADLAVLVIAADEGIKPQTKEAIKNIKEASIPLIVALNKIDKPGAIVQKVKEELMKEDIVIEEFGGPAVCIEISAKTGQNVDSLLEMINLMAEMAELETDLDKPAQGVVIEAHLDPRRGPIVTVLVREGILKTGDFIFAGSVSGKVKGLEDFQGKRIKEARPSQPALILGFKEVPQSGDIVKLGKAEVSEKRKIKEKPVETEPTDAPESKQLKIILKVDVFGSLEAIAESLVPLGTEQVSLQILKQEVGAINESDVKMASATGAVIIGFNVSVSPGIRLLAEKEKVRIKTYEVIYELVADVKEIMSELLEPEIVREDLGKLEVLQVFRTEKQKMIIGGKVISGKMVKDALIEVIRNEEKIGKGKIVQLQQEKKPADEVSKGNLAGISFEGNVKIEEGDTLQAYQEEKKKRTL